MDIESHISREQSLEPNHSYQSSQFLGSRDSSIDYANRIETQSNLSWTEHVMNIEWNYNYYQPWSDNEWLVDKMLAILDEDITMQ